ncbi:MAG: Queuine tRNA-ribosyltransferase [candidate division WS2 bacterium]|uniref:Queuine tRNA-ribosyltransferase n=1 Tax=Psychracetigena formicireducens TaxID=2986056 RepID=A0A9E2BFH2_PSYF1|nr:Queuine tRNA-ribosyltransferase [Candidatus Psychracetigena formicireducens]
MIFKVESRIKGTKIKAGTIYTQRGIVKTPVFMPVGTLGSVKTLASQDLENLGAQIILSNAYHLYLRPGLEVIEKHRGLHAFMNWKKPILIDSGGFQVMSLNTLRKVNNNGVIFKSHIDGSEHEFTPELVMKIHSVLHSDFAMPLDVCLPFGATVEEAEKAVNLTTSWAEKSITSAYVPLSNIMGIVQGGFYLPLRIKSLEEIKKNGFSGVALGGFSVGESKSTMYKLLTEFQEYLPDNKPVYLMGVGSPLAILKTISLGIDMFDSVLPTRLGRNGSAYTSKGRISLKNTIYKDDLQPLDSDCTCTVCLSYTRAYLRHLFLSGEILPLRLFTYHNLYYIINLVNKARQAIINDSFYNFWESFRNNYSPRGKEIEQEDNDNAD